MLSIADTERVIASCSQESSARAQDSAGGRDLVPKRLSYSFQLRSNENEVIGSNLAGVDVFRFDGANNLGTVMLRGLVVEALNSSASLIKLFENGEPINGAEVISDVNGIVAMQLMGLPLLLVVAGNRRHRMLRLGIEQEREVLTLAQTELRDIGRRQSFEGGTPEQPTWANGACVYLTEQHAATIQDVIRKRGVRLQSKHVVVSEEYEDLLDEALSARHKGESREAFLMRRVGAIESREVLLTQSLSMYPRYKQQMLLLEGKDAST